MLKQEKRTVTSICLFSTLLMILAVFQGCSALPANIAAPSPPANIAGYSNLAAGRKTYVSLLRCAMCHRPKPVTDYSIQTWTEDILPRMAKKARLSPREYTDVLAYVTTTVNSTHQTEGPNQ